MSRDLSLLKRGRTDNIVKSICRNIESVQSEVHMFNQREANLPGWVQNINPSYRHGQSTQLKKLSQPKYLLGLLTPKQKQNPQQSVIHRKVSNKSSFLLNQNQKRYMGFKNVSTVTKFLQTQISQPQEDYQTLQTKRILLEYQKQLQQQWNNVDFYRMHYTIKDTPKLRKTRADKILEKVRARRPITAFSQTTQFNTRKISTMITKIPTTTVRSISQHKFTTN